MEFRDLNNLETSFQKVRLYCICFTLLCAFVVGFSLWKSYAFAQEQRQKIYVLDNGKSLMLALSQDIDVNRPVEAREHARRFHELFFTLSPQKSAIEQGMERAFNLSDQSTFDYYKDLLEKGYYNRIITANIQQNIQTDSIRIDMNDYPYKGMYYGKQYIIRTSNITKRRLVTSFELVNGVRSDDNPQGFLLQKFTMVNNTDLETLSR